MDATTPSSYATRDEASHQRELATARADEVWEFYRPFAFVPGLAELVRVLNPTYGGMDMVVVVPPETSDVYVNSDAGERFLRDRFPRIRRHRVAPEALRLVGPDEGTVRCELRATVGPLRGLQVEVRAESGLPWTAERYGASRVWRSDLRCDGVDLRVAASARGTVARTDGPKEAVAGPATLYLGSFGRLVPLED